MTTGLGAVLVLLSIPAGFLAFAACWLYLDWPLIGLLFVPGLPIAALWYSQKRANQRPGGV
ncbi:MAG: hypothetical protein U0800_06450 [Isosphaeraceae bacterium]